MLPVSFAAIIFTLGLSVFLNTSFHGFKNYNHQLKDLTNWQETSLASAKRASIESSNLLTNIKSQLDSCLEEYSSLKKEQERAVFQCETDFDSSFTDFKKSLKNNYQNQLNTTIKYGLNPNETGAAYESFNYELYHSDKLPAAFKIGDELYNNALIKANHQAEQINLDDFDYYLNSGKLNIKAELLKTLIGKNNFDIVSKIQNQFNVSLSSSDLLEEKKLPNAIKLSINFKRRQAIDFKTDEEDKLSTQNLFAVGQLRTGTSDVEVVKTVCNQCGCPTVVCPPPPPPPEFDAIQQQITFGQFDNVSGRGIYFDNSQPASAQNQINIVNTSQNRFTSVYPGIGNFLTVNIGTFPHSGSVLQSSVNNANRLINPKQVEFATVSFDIDVPLGHELNIVGTNNLNVDIVPRARKRYMIAQKDFRVNGRVIPQGTILVGTLEPGSKANNPSFNDLSSIRAYSPSTGALMQIFKPGDQNKNDCSGSGQCMNINQFNGGGSNPNLPGSTIVTSFSTDKLFPGKSFLQANNLFVNIQRDLEVNSNMGIYNAHFDWQKDILRDDLNAQERTLITETLSKYSSSNPRDRQALIAELGVAFVRTGDPFVDDFQIELEQSFVDFVFDKRDDLERPGSILKSDLKDSKNRFLGLRTIYQDYMKADLTKRQADNKILSLIGKRLLFVPAPPQAPSHPGAAPVKPSKPICNKPKSNACKNKKNKYKNQLAKYNDDIKKYNKKLAKYRNDLSKYQLALKEYNEKYG